MAAGGIGFLNSQSPDTYSDRLRAFHRGLKETDYVENENVTVLYRWAENQIDRLPELAADLVRRQVAVIAAGNTPSVLAAKAVTTTIPTVFTIGDDPVRFGLVASLAQPGGNVTGINVFATELAANGWISCVRWCPEPLALPCSSAPPMLRPSPQ